jgi:hypothetical protein
MKIKGIIAAAVLFLACQSAPEIPADNSDITGKALVLNSIDYGVADRWYKIISETAPRILSVNSVVHGQHFFMLPFFQSYGRGPGNLVSITYDFVLLDPNGNVVESFQDIPAVNQTVKADWVLMATNYPLYSFQEDMPLGEYTIILKVKDQFAQGPYTIRSQIQLISMPNQKPLSGFEEYADYTQNYYSDPQPYLLPQAFIQLTKSEGLDANRLRVSLIFFHHVLLRNLYLLDDFIDLYPSLTPQGQTFLILLLSGFPELDMVKGFAQGLKEEPQALFSEASENGFALPSPIISHPVHLDMLWSEFFALGTYEPLFRLVQGLSLVENKGSMEEYQENPTEALGYEAMLEAMHQAIQWSLASNYRQHDLIRSYLRFMYEYEDLSETVKNQLGLIIEKGQDM